MSRSERITADSVPSDPVEIYEQYPEQIQEWKQKGGYLAAVARAAEKAATEDDQ